MKLAIAGVLALVAVAAAAPTEQTPQLVSQEFEIDPVGNYVFGYDIDNGNQRKEIGTKVTITDEDNEQSEVIVSEGVYYLFDSENRPHAVKYRADADGFHVESDLIPRA